MLVICGLLENMDSFKTSLTDVQQMADKAFVLI